MADARSADEYAQYLRGAGLWIDRIEPHDDALTAMVHDIRTKLLAVELLVKLKQVNLPSLDFEQTRTLARAAADAVKDGRFGYALIIATKPTDQV